MPTQVAYAQPEASGVHVRRGLADMVRSSSDVVLLKLYYNQRVSAGASCLWAAYSYLPFARPKKSWFLFACIVRVLSM